MKLTDLALLFAIIMLPTHFVLDGQAMQVLHSEQQFAYLDRVLRAATDDASYLLAKQSEVEAQMLEHISERFMNSLSQTLGALDAAWRNDYDVLLVALDDDGYHLFSQETWRDERGMLVVNNVWQPKRRFSATDARGNTYLLGYDNKLSIHWVGRNQMLEGNREELFEQTKLPLLAEERRFSQWKLLVITKQLEQALHDTTGGRFEFMFPKQTLPGIHDEEAGNQLDGVGLIAYIYEKQPSEWSATHYAFASSKLVSNE